MSLVDQAYRTAKAAEQLGIPPSTLRTYAGEFRMLLSPDAGADTASTGGGFRHRRYTEADLAILPAAKALLEEGFSYRSDLSQLAGVAAVEIFRSPQRRPTPRRPRNTSNPATVPREERLETTLTATFRAVRRLENEIVTSPLRCRRYRGRVVAGWRAFWESVRTTIPRIADTPTPRRYQG